MLSRAKSLLRYLVIQLSIKTSHVERGSTLRGTWMTLFFWYPGIEPEQKALKDYLQASSFLVFVKFGVLAFDHC